MTIIENTIRPALEGKVDSPEETWKTIFSYTEPGFD